MRHGSSASGLAVILLVFAGAGAAQESKPKELPDAPVAKQDIEAPKHESPLHATIEILGRRSAFFPSIATSKGPLSSKQKFELFADESVSSSRFLSSAAGAGIGQARNSLAGYGQGMSGYGKRFGSSMATAASTNFFGTYVIASALHRDPRYFVTLRGGAGHRIAYALSRIVVSRTDDGRDCGKLAGNPGSTAGREPGKRLSAGERTNGGRDVSALRITGGIEHGQQRAAGILADDLSQPAHLEDCPWLKTR